MIKVREVKGGGCRSGYPRLMAHTASALIVLAVNEHIGLAVRASNVYKLGEEIDIWRDESFKDYHGILELSNE